MPWSRGEMEAQLARQAVWLRDSLLWMIDWKILSQWDGAGRPVALDVGCGPGHVMEIVRKVLDVAGVDVDHVAVETCHRKGLKAGAGTAENLPFDDSSFDVVYCSFLMLWLKDPVRAVQEMKRVSRGWIVCLAEPDLGGRIDHPEELSGLRNIVARGIQSEGGDPYIGRKLRGIFGACGLEADMGVHAGVWPLEKVREESEAEWRYVERTADIDSKEGLRALRRTWDESLAKGSMFQYNPVFFAFAKK